MTDQETPANVRLTDGLGPLVESAGLLACVDDEYLTRGDWVPLVQAFADAVRAEERARWTRAVMAELDGNGQAHAIVAYAAKV